MSCNRWVRGSMVPLVAAAAGHAALVQADPGGAGGGGGPNASADADAGSSEREAGADSGAAAPDAGGSLVAAEGRCVEHIPEGKARPSLSESLPARGTVGHVAHLRVAVKHGKGEAVLPDGFRPQLGSEQMQALERAGFILPDPDGGAGLGVSRELEGERATTTVRIPVVPLPSEPGRHELQLPPLPIAIARASGERITVCTKPHTMVVEEPTANTPQAMPRDNPPTRRQLEEWTTAKHIAYASLVALLVGALVAWLVGKWLRRPKPTPPPPPPRPPWEVALEQLHDIRHARLIEAERFDEHFDRVSFAVREYLGDRYGFDGLESTTREMLSVLRRVAPPIAVLSQIQTFLRKADLVKFARLTPTAAECQIALDAGEEIVQRTVPAFTGAEQSAPAGGADPAGADAAGSSGSSPGSAQATSAPAATGEESSGGEQ